MIIYDKSNSHFDALTNQIEATSTAQKMKFSIKDFFSKCDQIRRKMRIWSHSLKKSSMENFIFCAVINFFLENLTQNLFLFLPQYKNFIIIRDFNMKGNIFQILTVAMK